MEREIKFRALKDDMSDFRMVYGNLLYIGSQAKIQEGNKAVFSSVFEKTIGQYTGLKDKNGVEIYEGDIYQTQGEKKVCYQVFFIGGAFVGGKSADSTMPLGWSPTEYNDDMTECGFCSEQVEVIGNNHQNPELINIPK
jgi:uncharacterized phage protein (TIGR01671 family)